MTHAEQMASSGSRSLLPAATGGVERTIDERRGDTRRALVNIPASNKYPVPSNIVWLGFSFLLSVAPLSEPAIFGGSRRGIPTYF